MGLEIDLIVKKPLGGKRPLNFMGFFFLIGGLNGDEVPVLKVA